MTNLSVAKKDQEEIQMQQAHMMERFKQTPEFDLLKNTFLALKFSHAGKRRSSMRAQATRENCLYHSGVEDGIELCLEEIDKIIANGVEIRAAREFEIANQEE